MQPEVGATSCEASGEHFELLSLCQLSDIVVCVLVADF